MIMNSIYNKPAEFTSRVMKLITPVSVSEYLLTHGTNLNQEQMLVEVKLKSSDSLNLISLTAIEAIYIIINKW